MATQINFQFYLFKLNFYSHSHPTFEINNNVLFKNGDLLNQPSNKHFAILGDDIVFFYKDFHLINPLLQISIRCYFLCNRISFIS